jgi:hypothetical protein
MFSPGRDEYLSGVYRPDADELQGSGGDAFDEGG